MPRKNGKMTHLERNFVPHMAKTGDAVYAAAKAGYAHPPSAATRLVARDPVMAAVEQAKRRLALKGMPMAVDTLLAAADQATAGVPWATKVKASVEIIHIVAGSAEMAEKADAAEMQPEVFDAVVRSIVEAHEDAALRRRTIEGELIEAKKEGAFG